MRRTGSATEFLQKPENGELTCPVRPLLRRDSASRYLLDTWGIRRAPATLAKLAVVGGGPRFYRAGRWPMYDPADLDAWAGQLIGEARTSTSEHKTA